MTTRCDESEIERSRAVTVLLQRAAEGGPQPAQELLPLVYDELRSLARARVGQEAPCRAGYPCASRQTVQATALVHEASGPGGEPR